MELVGVQIPNFVLAAPTLMLSFAAVRSYFRRDPARFLSLGNLGTHKMLARLRGAFENDSAETDEFSKPSILANARGQETGFSADGAFVFVAQLVAMALFAALFMHVQVCVGADIKLLPLLH